MVLRTWPTLAAELLAARARHDPAEQVILALRQHRAELRMSQRQYALTRGWSKSHAARLESTPGTIRLDDLREALAPTGHQLVVLPTDVTIPRDDRPAAALLARDVAGRRLPAHVFVGRTTYPREWWEIRHAYDRPRWPLWSWWRDESLSSRVRQRWPPGWVETRN